jgi:hypothetical protein
VNRRKALCASVLGTSEIWRMIARSHDQLLLKLMVISWLVGLQPFQSAFDSTDSA